MSKRMAFAAVLLSSLQSPSPALAQTEPTLVIHKPTPGSQRPEKDPNEIVITDIGRWNHPTKAVFEHYGMKLTKVELRWHGTYPVFHVADFGGDPTSGAAAKDFDRFNFDILKANGFNSFMVVEDNDHDGFAITYDRKARTIQSDVVQGVDP